MASYAVLAEECFHYLISKTGNAMIRYKPEEVACVIDSVSAGKTATEILGYGNDIPVVATLSEALRYSPDTLLLGAATPGGELPESWRLVISGAIRNELNIVSGLHAFLSNDNEFSDLAEKHGVNITDLRKPPTSISFTKGSWRWRRTPVVLTVGTDCDTGKMTTAWEIKIQLEEEGKRVAFVGTGQTGILLGGVGVAVDAVISDFVPGAIETEIDRVAADHDVVIVEGQGSITHYAYSGVTLGLLHGAMPDLMVLCDQPGRDVFYLFDFPLTPFRDIMNLYLILVNTFKECAFAGISLFTRDMIEVDARQAVKDYENRYGIPTTDPIRFGAQKITDRILMGLEVAQV